ncbi:Hypothetical protein PHPALM_3980 [Phytophthora palmivora]|uniref:Uncharacterized protein n=1 Tax=Phytophthora palmivora TaxID=4796 RepID=A0A2P4YL01_9STRA|nr:Hypothetical protein PHPALM_3980 [Phytophthora palmivora]
MVNSKIHNTITLGAVTLCFSTVNAHGYLGKPAVTFPNDVDKTQFIATIESTASGLAGSFSGSPAENTAAFSTAFSSSKYSSLKEFVTDLGQIVANGANIECGLTDPNGTPQPLPAELEWTHSDTEGFTSSHEGPCEAWCDDTRIFQDSDCAAHFTTAPAKMPYDETGCSGASRLTFYWLALHSSTWQVYANCAALEGGSGSFSPTQSNSTSSGGSMGQSNTPTVTDVTPMSITTTPTATTSTPTIANSAPSPGNSVAGSTDEDDCDSLDVAGSNEEDCDSFDVAGSGEDEVAGDADTNEEDCDSLDVAGNSTEAVSESSLDFGDVDGNYISGKAP